MQPDSPHVHSLITIYFLLLASRIRLKYSIFGRAEIHKTSATRLPLCTYLRARICRPGWRQNIDLRALELLSDVCSCFPSNNTLIV